MNKKRVVTSSKDGSSTREMILDMANEIANSAGMVDFRIDTLAQSLSISPGNITYHFPRKDDISEALWGRCRSNIESSIDAYITPFIDIKQLYLIVRYIISSLHEYRGVAMYMLGDCGVCKREKASFNQLYTLIKQRYSDVLATLVSEGYITDSKSNLESQIRFESLFTILGWWINHAHSLGGIDKERNSEYYALMVISTLEQSMTQKGMEQFRSIKELLEKDNN